VRDEAATDDSAREIAEHLAGVVAARLGAT
jgi:hypothetical protein